MRILTSLTRKIQTWNQFSNLERWLLLQALTLLPLVALCLKLSGLQRTYTFLSCLIPQPTCSSSFQLQTTANAVQIAAKYYTWATCLRKSLVLWFLLRRQGIAAELQIGTRFEQGEFQAHAWVEYQGDVVGDRRSIREYFTTFNNLKLE